MCLNVKQQRFVDEYVKTGNATKAARRAGYKNPNSNAARMMVNDGIRKAIDSRLKEMESHKIADAKEIMEFLSASMRGEINEEVITRDGHDWKQISQRDRLRAAELLAKRYRLVDAEPVEARVRLMVDDDDVEDG